MKLLKIENNAGYFLAQDGSVAEVDKITKEDLLRMVDVTLQEEDVEYDEYSDEELRNQAHQIVYKNVFEKLKELRGRRKEFIDESERLYLTEYEKYRSTPEEDEQ
jgi:hypothetical protein